MASSRRPALDLEGCFGFGFGFAARSRFGLVENEAWVDASDSDGTVLGPTVASNRFLRKARVEARAADVAVTAAAPPGTTAWGDWKGGGKLEEVCGWLGGCETRLN